MPERDKFMDLKSFYDNVGGDYDVMMGRMGNKEERIVKFLNKFTKDPSFENLREALSAGNAEEAFRAAHTIKGVALNLELMDLQESSGRLTDLLRDGEVPDDAHEIFKQVEVDYQKATDCISQL